MRRPYEPDWITMRRPKDAVPEWYHDEPESDARLGFRAAFWVVVALALGFGIPWLLGWL